MNFISNINNYNFDLDKPQTISVGLLIRNLTSFLYRDLLKSIDE